MKVLKGIYKGVELATPDNMNVRPTVDHFKKHILRVAEEAKPKIVWDLFAGSGGVGIELLSQGANETVFVEQLKAAVSSLRLNLAECNLKNPAEFSKQKTQVVMAPVESFLKDPVSYGVTAKPGLVFLDPPYGQKFMAKIAPLLALCPLISGGTLIVAEHVTDDPVPATPGLAIESTEVYGPKVLTLLRKIGSA